VTSFHSMGIKIFLKKRLLTKLLLAGAIFFLWVHPAKASGIQVSASVDNSEITLEDSLRLSVRVDGVGSAPSPELPDLQEFIIHSQGKSSSVSIVNGKKTSSVTFNYLLTPKKQGEFTIGPVKFEIDGNPYITAPIQVVVKEQTQRSLPSTNIFAEAEVFPHQPFVNEQMTLTVRLFYKVEVRNIRLEMDTTRFRKEDLGESREYSRVINGVRYQVHEMSVALFPLRPGRFDFPPATVSLDIVRREKRESPFDSFFPDSFFNSVVRTEPKVLRTRLIPLKVLALPEKPDDFSNLVGQFNITAELSRNSLEAGDTTTLTLTVSGTGNAMDLALKLPDLDGERLKIYEDRPTYQQEIQNNKITGQKIFNYALVPLEAGTSSLPSIPLVYFDPLKRKYIKAQTPPIELDVQPALNKESLTIVRPETAIFSQEEQSIKIIGKDILPLHTNSEDFQDHRLTGPRMFWIVLGLILPALLFILYVCIYQYRQRMKWDTAFSRNRTAYKTARDKLDRLMTVQNEKDFARQLSSILREYIGNKLNLQGTAFTPLEMEALLMSRNFGEGQILLASKLLNQCETHQYSKGQDTDHKELLEESKFLLEQLEKES